MARPSPMVNQPYYPQTAGMQPQATSSMGLSPSQQFVQNPGYPNAAPQVYGQYQGALGQWGATSVAGQGDYNSALINAANANNQGMFMGYDKTWDQYMFDQAVQNGMFQTPSTGGRGGMQMAGPLGGAVIGAVGTYAAAIGSFGGRCSTLLARTKSDS